MTPSDRLLERTEQLELLAEALALVDRERVGRLVLVGGEAGVGKTVLLREFSRRQSGRVVWGACEPLLTPGPLGPFFDVAATLGGELEELVRREARPHEVTAALIRALDGASGRVLVLEDLHWADEATLDVVRLLARRIELVPALVVVSYRSDALERTHPLAVLLGELVSIPTLVRIELPRLSPAAVEALAEPHDVDAADLYRRTAGNPFYVTEVLAAGTGEVPATVRDAVLARVARLSAPARSLLEAIAVAAPQAELWLLESLAPDELAQLDECLASGMVAGAGDTVSFRHELARLAVEEALAPNRRIDLHRRAVEVLTERPDEQLARLAHHAEAAGDGAAVFRFAPAAARRAGSLGAHREAAAQYARALRFAGDLDAQRQAELLEGRAYECYLTGQLDAAITAQEAALERRRGLGDRRAEGDCLRSLSRLDRFQGRTAEAAELGLEAVACLEDGADERELALAYVNLSHLYTVSEDLEPAVDWSSRALELGDRLGDSEVVAYALTNLGAVELLAEAPEAPAQLEAALELALSEGLEENAGRAYLNLVWWPLLHRRYELVERWLEVGLAYCRDRGLDLWHLFFVPCRARFQLDRGRWAEAAESAAVALADSRTWPVPRVCALTTLALTRVRRGEPDENALLDEALALAAPTGELQRLGLAAAARAEAAWLAGDLDAVADATDEALDLALRRGSPWAIGELACWRKRAGHDSQVGSGVAAPWAAELAGNWADAAELWSELGCPYESALALAQADDPDLLRRALDQLQALDARPAAAIVAQRLRERGVRGLPRGPRPATKANPAGLTARELEVLELLAQGLRNADIADRLFLSHKTVGHHVSAVLRKLGVSGRGEAAAEARRLGIGPQDGDPGEPS